MNPPDEDKTAFTTGWGVYCYKVIPFGLKNARGHVPANGKQGLQGPYWEHHRGICDDMLVKSIRRTEHLQYLDKTFNLLRQYEVKLNPEKCTFRVASVKFLGYLVTQRGIEADHDKISSILNMRSPTSIKEIQILNGHLVTLNRFISRSTDKCKLFFLALKKGQWTFAGTRNVKWPFRS